MLLSILLLALLVFVIGLAIGSFLNVVIHRVPLGESIVRPASRCPACGAAVRPLDNIPLLSYARLRGRCRQCGARISPLYPAVELLTAVTFVLLLLKTGPTWELAFEAAFAAALIALVFIDARHQLLPDVITYPLLVFAVAATAVRAGWGAPQFSAFDFSIYFAGAQTEFVPRAAALPGAILLAAGTPALWLLDWLDVRIYSFFPGEESWEELTDEEAAREESAARRQRRAIYGALIAGLLLAIGWACFCLRAGAGQVEQCELAYGGLWRAAIGAVVGGGVIWWLRALYFFVRRAEGMGLGDVKMMAGVGAFLGWQGAFSVLLLGSVLGVAVGIVLARRGRTGLRTALPFGVCLGAAALAYLFVSVPFFQWRGLELR